MMCNDNGTHNGTCRNRSGTGAAGSSGQSTSATTSTGTSSATSTAATTSTGTSSTTSTAATTGTSTSTGTGSGQLDASVAPADAALDATADEGSADGSLAD